MKQGTTPTIIIVLSGALISDLDNYEIVLKQTGKNEQIIKYQKDRIEVDIEKNQFKVKMTQTETLSFGVGIFKIQCRIRFPDGTAFATDIKTLTMDELLSEDVIE